MSNKFSSIKDKKKFFSGVMCIFFAFVFYGSMFFKGYTISKLVFGTLLLYFGMGNIRLSKQ